MAVAAQVLRSPVFPVSVMTTPDFTPERPKKSYEELALFIQKHYDITSVNLRESELCHQLKECRAFLFGERHTHAEDRRHFVTTAHSIV